MTYEECFRLGCDLLAGAGLEEAKLDARLLLEYVCHTSRNDLLVHGDRPVEQADADRYRKLIAGRAERIPLQHLTGSQEFMGLEFAVNEHVLIPRQDTEILVEEVLRELHDGMRILDMCTGSGCILISLLHYSNDCQGVGVDISEEALAVAWKNAEKILADKGCKKGQWSAKQLSGEQLLEMQLPERQSAGEQSSGEFGSAFTFLRSDLFENVTGKFEFIVSNPPYIPSGVIPTLMSEVREHEPLMALDGYEDGLYFYRRIISESREYLVNGGMLYFEIGYDQAEAVSGLMKQAGFCEIKVVKDYGGFDRVVYGTYIGQGVCWERQDQEH